MNLERKTNTTNAAHTLVYGDWYCPTEIGTGTSGCDSNLED